MPRLIGGAVLDIFADGLLLDVAGGALIIAGISQGVPLLTMGITLTIVQLAVKKINRYTPSQCAWARELFTSEGAKKVKVLSACLSLIVCEISLVAALVIAAVAGVLAAFSLPNALEMRRKQIPKVYRRTSCAPPPLGIF